jgi:hypothetical protein
VQILATHIQHLVFAAKLEKRMEFQRRNLLLFLSYFLQYRLSPNLHAAEGEPFLAQVLQRGPEMIDGVVDAVYSKME